MCNCNLWIYQIRAIQKLPNSEQFSKGKFKAHKYINRQISQQPGNCESRIDPHLVQAFLKKWWVKSDFKTPNLPLSLRLKGFSCHYNSIYINTGRKRGKIVVKCSTKFSKEGRTSIENHLHQQSRVT